jgi:preprotein translocase subunit YajC
MGETIQAAVAQAGGQGSMLQMIPWIIGMVFVFYFFMIRPERKRATDHQTLVSSLKKGDEIVLTSGIIGKIHALDERTVTLDLDGGKTKVRVLKQAVTGLAARMLAGPEDKKALEEKKPDDKKSSSEDKKALDADDASKKSA